MLKKLLISIITLVTLSTNALPAYAAVNPRDSACSGLQSTGVAVNCTDEAAARGAFGNILKTVINILSIVVGAISVVMIIIGGFRYVVSGGDSNGTAGAKNTIIYALVGLIVVLFAQVIVRFVLANART